MKIRISTLKRMIAEVLRDEHGDPAVDTCRACSGEGKIAGEHCATCAGSGEELACGSTHPGIGRGPLPYRM